MASLCYLHQNDLEEELKCLVNGVWAGLAHELRGLWSKGKMS